MTFDPVFASNILRTIKLLTRTWHQAGWMTMVFWMLMVSVGEAQNISTVAGNNTQGFSGDGGAATSAQLGLSTGNGSGQIYVDASGNLYIADWNNNRIRKVDTSGNISTVAGTGVAGFSGDGGAATSAQLNAPRGILGDAAGNLYIADAENFRIRKVDTSGNISTIAGTGVDGSAGDGGAATSATISAIRGLSFDSAGNLYVSDVNNHKVRKIDTSGIITTVAGTGTQSFSGDGGAATSATFNTTIDVFADSLGNFYISDRNNDRIRKVDSSGNITTVAGNGVGTFAGDGGTATSASLLDPYGVSVDGSGNLFIADRDNHRIRKVDVSGVISTVAGTGTNSYSGDGGLATSATLKSPDDVFIDRSGNLYIQDRSNFVIRKVTHPLTESTASAGLSGATTTAAGSEVQLLSTGITGDGSASVISVGVKISDLSSATGLAAGDFSSVKLYRSTDATLDSGDTLLGTQTTINVGGTTIVTATLANVPPNGSATFYIVSAVISGSATTGHAFRVGFTNGAINTSFSGMGTEVVPNDANKVTLSNISETSTATGLSGLSVLLSGVEKQVYSIGMTGDGVAGMDSLRITLSDSSTSTGLVSGDFSSLKLYRSTDAVLDGSDSLMATQSTVNIGSTTKLAPVSRHIPSASTQVYYLVSATLSSGATSGRVYRVGFAAGDVFTNTGTKGTAVTASDANRVRVAGLTESVAASGLSGSSTVLVGNETKVFGIGLTGDGVAGVNSVTLTLSDLSSATGLASSDISSLKLYRSADATLDAGDTLLGTQSTVNVGSSTTVSTSSTDVPSSGSTQHYLVSALLSSSAVSGRAFKVGFASGGVNTNTGTTGNAVSASDANRVTVAGLTESVTASGLSGVSTVLPNSETKVFSVGLTGDGVAGMSSLAVTISDSSTSTGLASGDFSSLKLYRSLDATLDGSDSLMATQITVNIGSGTTLTPASTHIIPASSQVYYLVSATLSSGATSGRVYRVGFASGGITTTATSVGTAVTASDANRVRVAGLTESVTASGLSGVSTVLPSNETRVFHVGITGDGVAGVDSIRVTISDSSASTGLASSDFSSLKLYKSLDATLDGSDSLMATQSTVNVGSVTKLAPASRHIPAASTQVYYLVSATLNSSVTSGRVLRLGFASGDVFTNAGTKGTTVTASDANRVRVAGLTESVTATGLSGVSTVLPSSETKVFSIGLTGDGVAGVSSVTVTVSDSSTSTGLASSDFDSLKLYRSSDTTLDSGDTLIGSQTTVTVGSATTISVTSTNIPSSGTQVYYLVSAKLSSSVTSGRVFRVGFASGGVATNASAVGSAVTASDANRVRVSGLTESMAAVGLSGVSTVLPSSEVQVFRYALVGDGVAGVNSITVTVSDSSTSTGLSSSDFSSLKLYSSTDATLDSGDTLLGTQTTVNVGSTTTVSTSSTHIPSSGSTVYYLVSATLSSSAVRGHVFRLGFATGGVTTNASAAGSAVVVSDANRVRVAGLTESVAASGVSGVSTVLPSSETKVFAIGLTGDGVAGVSGITVTLSDSSTSSGLASSDFDSLKLYVSSDATLSSDDILIGSQTTVNVGSTTTISATSTNIPSASSTVYYLVGAKLNSSAVSGHVFRLGFASGGVTTNASSVGTSIAASDANRVRVAGLTESVVATGLSGVSIILPGVETKVFDIGLTGDGVAGVSSVTVTVSDSSTSSGLVSSDFDSLKLYVSSDATLSSDDTLIGSQTTVNIGSATTVSATATNIPSASATVYYLLGAKLSSSAVSGRVFRLGFAVGGVTTNASAVGTVVSASDADRVRVAGLTSGAVATGLSGASTVLPGTEVQIFRYGLVGDGVAGLNSVTLTLSDLSTSTGLSSTDVDSLKLYHSTDVTLDSGDTLIGSQTSVNVGSATTVSATSTDIPASGTTRYYLVSVKLSATAVGDHAFKVGFDSGGVSTNAGTSGTVVTANDANKVTVTGITETTVAAGLSGDVKVVPKQEAQIFGLGLTGNGVAGLNGVTLTLSDLTTATGLVAGDLDSLKLYRSSDATLDSGDTLIGSQATVNVGSATTVSATTTDILSATTQYHYLVSVVMSSAAVGNHALKVSFASGGVSTTLGGKGSVVAASDANLIRVLSPPVLVRFNGISMNDATPMLDWADVVGAVSYVLEVSDSSNFVSINTIDSLTQSQYTFTTDLEDGSYFWRVKAVSSVGSTQLSTADVFKVASKRTDPQGVALRVAKPKSGQILGIGDTVRVQVLAYRALSALDTVIVGLSTSTTPEHFGNIGLIDTLTQVSGVGASVDTFAFHLVVKAGLLETSGSGVVAQARVSVRNDGLPLKAIDNQSVLPMIGDLPDFGLVGDRVMFGVDGQRPLNSNFFQMAMIDTTALPNTGGRVFGVRTTSHGAANNQQLIRSFKTGDDVTLRLKAGNIGEGGAVSAHLYVVDAVMPGYQVPDSSLYAAKIDLGDLIRANGDLRVTFKATEGQFQHAMVKQNLRVKVLGYVVDGAGNLSANTTGAVSPQGYEQDIWVVADTQMPVVDLAHPQKEGERFTGRVDTSVVYRKDDGSLDTVAKFNLKPLQFGTSEGTMARWAIVGTDTAVYGGVSDTTRLKVVTQDSFAFATRPVVGQKVDLQVVVKDSVGNKGTATVADVVLDEVAPTISSLFPASRKLPKGNPTINPTMLSPSFLVNEGLDSVSVRYVQIGGSHMVTSHVATVADEGITVAVSDSLIDEARYTLQVFVRDLAGNIQMSGLDTLVYESTIENPKADSFVVALDSVVTVVDSVIAGVNLPLVVTAWDAKVPNASLVALTYDKVGVLIQAQADGQDVSDVSFGGVGVQDHGNGTATLDGKGWIAGSRVVLVKSTRVLDSLSVVVMDTTWAMAQPDSLDVNFSGQISGLTVDAGAFDHYAVVARENGQETRVVSGAFDLWVQPTDAYGNASNKVLKGAVNLQSADSLVTSTCLLDTRVPSGNVKESTWVTFSGNLGDASLPQGAQEIPQMGRLFSGVAPNRAGDGLVIGVRVSNVRGDSVGVAFGQSAPLSFVAPIDEDAEKEIVPNDPVAPANVIVQDFLGPDGKGDQGRYVMLSFGHTLKQIQIKHYRVYREVLVASGLNDAGEVVALETSELRFVPWAVVEVPPGDVPRVIQSLVPALDNVVSRWAVAGEWGGVSVEGGPLGKQVFAKAEVAQVMDVLGLEADSGAVDVPLEVAGETGLVLAQLDVDLGAWRSVPDGVRTKSGMLKTTEKVISESVRAVDNLPPRSVTGRQTSVSDDESTVTLGWQPSVDDKVVGVVYYRGYGVPILGVETYEILRGDKVETLAPVAILPAGSNGFSEPFLPGAVYRIDVLDLDNRTKGEPFRVDRAGPTLSVGVDTVRAGELATVDISIDRAKGMAGGTITLNYDASAMTAEDVIAGDLASDMLVLGRTDVPGEVTLTLAGASGLDLDAGTLATIRFSTPIQVAGDYALTLSSVELFNASSEVLVLSDRISGHVSVVSNQVQIQVGDVTVDAGQRVVVPVGVDNALGLAGGEWTLTYDANVMTAVGVEAGALANASDMLVLGRTDVLGEVKMTVAGAQALESGSGELVRVVFDVHADLSDGFYEVGVRDVAFRNAAGEMMAVADGQVGVVTIPEGGPGVQVIISKVIAIAGAQDVVVSIGVDRAIGVAGGEMTLRYDASVFEAMGVEAGALAQTSGMLVLGRTDVLGEVKVTVVGARGLTDVSGEWVKVRFRVKTDAFAGTYGLDVADATFRNASGEMMTVGKRVDGQLVVPALDAGIGVRVGDANTGPGITVAVGVAVDRAVGLAGGELVLVYDQAIFTAQSVQAGAIANGMLVIGRTDVLGEVKVVFAGSEGLVAEAGELAVVTFEVANSAPDGTYEMRLGSEIFRDASGNTLLVSERQSGLVTVAASADFDGDGNLTASDVTLFAKYLGTQQSAGDYDRRFDMNRDGYVSFQDFIAFVENFSAKREKPSSGTGEIRSEKLNVQTEQSR